MGGNGTTAPDRQLRNEWGNQSNLGAIVAPQIGDRAYADGLTMPWIEGYYVFTSLGWVLLGGAGGGVTSIAQGDGITCTPNPIIAAGTVAARYGNTATDVNRGTHDHSGAAGMGLILPPTSVTDPGTLDPADVLLDDHLRNGLIHNMASNQEVYTSERPDAFHFFNSMIDTHGYEVETGYENQRCMAYSRTYHNTYYLFNDDNVMNEETYAQIMLRIENHDYTIGSKGARERTVWDVVLQLYDYLGNPIVQPLGKDMCLTIDANDNLHVYFLADDFVAPSYKGVYDCYISIAATPSLQAPPAAGPWAVPPPININAQAELVNTDHTGHCRHMSAAFSPNSNPPLGIVSVVWEQDIGRTTGIYNNVYNPAAPAGSRYLGLMPMGQILVSNPGINAYWPTIEIGNNNAYCMWVEDDGSGGGDLKFGTSPTVPGGWLTWNVLAAGLSVSDYVAGCPPNVVDPFSIVVATYTTYNLDIVYAVVRDNVSQGEKVFLVLYGNFLTTGLGAAYPCSLYDTYRTSSPRTYQGEAFGMRAFFQLGISHIQWAAGEDAPVVMMLHTERDGYYYAIGNQSCYATYLTLLVPDLTSGIIPSTIPISPSAVVGDNGSGTLVVQISPKVHYAYFAYNRSWQNQQTRPFRYYPFMVHGKMVLGTFSAKVGGGWIIEVISSLWMKDTPEYPYKNDVHTY